FMPTTGLAVTKTPIVPSIPDLLSLFLSSTSFNSSFGHSQIFAAPLRRLEHMLEWRGNFPSIQAVKKPGGLFWQPEELFR
ncbi:MAG TPA: hypothetical protein H9701_08120, partial [Candidatus Intestinimonas pullistercoris]|nr:hypothetical protein [Candidatus Intestinimonas pullistercoris]